MLQYLTVFALSMVKFLGGPLAGASMGMAFGPTFGLTVAGMMTSVGIFSVIGARVSEWYTRRARLRGKPVFSSHSRRTVRVFQRFGIGGIAFLTPLIFSPIVGTILATVLGVDRRRILLHMLWSAVLWSAVFTLFLNQFSGLMQLLRR
jgi:MFS family permease